MSLNKKGVSVLMASTLALLSSSAFAEEEVQYQHLEENSDRLIAGAKKNPAPMTPTQGEAPITPKRARKKPLPKTPTQAGNAQNKQVGNASDDEMNGDSLQKKVPVDTGSNGM